MSATADWVPAAVKAIAAVLPVGKDISNRLLSDGRMKDIWPALLRIAKEEVGIDGIGNWQRLTTWGIFDQGVSRQEQACAALFAYAVVEFSGERVVGTRSDFDQFAKESLSAAELCRAAIERDGRPRIDPALAAALKVVADYFEEQGQRRLQSGSPYVVERSSRARGEDVKRGRVRALALEMHRLFGSFRYGTTATIAMVALEGSKISARDVENWCSKLTPRGDARP